MGRAWECASEAHQLWSWEMKFFGGEQFTPDHSLGGAANCLLYGGFARKPLWGLADAEYVK